MTKRFLRLVPAAALCIPWVATAQAGRSDPAAPDAPFPALAYQSAFADYKPWQEIKAGDWRVVNDTVRDASLKTGGHAAGHAAPTPPSKITVEPSAAMTATSPHGSHQMRGGKK